MRSSKKIIRGLCSMSVFLGLAACGGKSTPLGDQPTLSGQIEGWTRGEGFTLQATAPGSVMLGSAPIDGAGNFSITLAGQSVLTGKLVPLMASSEMSGGREGCSGNVTFDPATIYQAQLKLRATKGTTTVEVDHSSAVTIGLAPKVVSYIFVESDANQIGSAECTDPMFHAKTTYDVHFKAGWNRQVSLLNAYSQTDLDIVTHTGDLPDGVAWRAR